MNLLMDTHTLLWWLDDNPTLTIEARHLAAERKTSFNAIIRGKIEEFVSQDSSPPGWF